MEFFFNNLYVKQFVPTFYKIFSNISFHLLKNSYELQITC